MCEQVYIFRRAVETPLETGGLTRSVSTSRLELAVHVLVSSVCVQKQCVNNLAMCTLVWDALTLNLERSHV